MNRKHGKNKHTEKTDREKISEKISRRFDVPIDGISDVGLIELKGDGEILITGCSSILEYNPETIVIRTGKKTVKITGSRMTMMTFTNNSTSVGGKIYAVYPNYDFSEDCDARKGEGE